MGLVGAAVCIQRRRFVELSRPIGSFCPSVAPLNVYEQHIRVSRARTHIRTRMVLLGIRAGAGIHFLVGVGPPFRSGLRPPSPLETSSVAYVVAIPLGIHPNPSHVSSCLAVWLFGVAWHILTFVSCFESQGSGLRAQGSGLRAQGIFIQMCLWGSTF